MRSAVARLDWNLAIRPWRGLVVAAVALGVVAFPTRLTGPALPAPAQGPVGLATPSSVASLTPAPTDTPAAILSFSPGPSSSPAANPGTTPTPAPVLLCRSSQLSAVVQVWTVSAGMVTGHIVATNASTRPCYLRGQAEGQVVDGDRAVVGDSGAATASIAPDDPFYQLSPGDRMNATVVWANWCGRSPAQPITAALILPQGLGRLDAGYEGHTPIPLCTGADDTRVSSARWTP